MSTEPEGPRRQLPERPNLRHLRDEAKDLFKAGGAESLSDAQFKLARGYGFESWPKLKAHVDYLGDVGGLKEAIDANDLKGVQDLMTRNPALHRAPLGYGGNGPLTWVAECRVPWEPPGETRLEMARWMIRNGSDVHQGGDMPLMRAALFDLRIPMMELLVEHGADVNGRCGGTYPVVCAPCETLAPAALSWLLEHGAEAAVESGYGSLVSMLIGTYSRNAAGKHRCLEVLADAGFEFPDTPVVAFHRGRIDLLEEHLRRDASLLGRRFSEAEIFPAALGLKPGDGLHLTPVDGTTLLHLSIEYDDLEIARWCIERGADVNARSAVDAEGFGGHTPLFHSVVCLGNRDDTKARLLLDAGADPNFRTTLRKKLRDMGDPEKERMHEFRDVTPISYARRFQEPRWRSEPAIAALLAAGGTE